MCLKYSSASYNIHIDVLTEAGNCSSDLRLLGHCFFGVGVFCKLFNI